MTIKEFNLLELEVYQNDELIYQGMSENVPEDLKEKQIKIEKLDGKKIIVKILN